MEQPFVAHLIELRDRLLRVVMVVGAIFIVLFPFANDLYIMVATPLMAHLPAGTSMIATDVASPFLTPFKLTLMASLFLAMPVVLYQLWAFVAPGLYMHEKRMAMPLVASSIVLFYTGMVFAYFIVFPLVFAFLTSTVPDGVTVATDIAKYLDFILTLFFAFGMAFEVPIATIILVWTGMTTPKKMASKRPYIIVGAFLLGMLLTPPDVISQTLLALPMWVLFEIGVIFSRFFVRKKEDGDNLDGEAEAATSDQGAEPDAPETASKATQSSNTIPEFDGDPSPDGDIDPDRYVPLTEEELDAELELIEAEEDDDDDDDDSDFGESDDEEEEAPSDDKLAFMAQVDAADVKLKMIDSFRQQGMIDRARTMLYEVLAEGSDDQIMVARNILKQLDED